jgi:hypothetical protein
MRRYSVDEVQLTQGQATQTQTATTTATTGGGASGTPKPSLGNHNTRSSLLGFVMA